MRFGVRPLFPTLPHFALISPHFTSSSIHYPQLMLHFTPLLPQSSLHSTFPHLLFLTSPYPFYLTKKIMLKFSTGFPTDEKLHFLSFSSIFFHFPSPIAPHSHPCHPLFHWVYQNLAYPPQQTKPSPNSHYILTTVIGKAPLIPFSDFT